MPARMKDASCSVLGSTSESDGSLGSKTSVKDQLLKWLNLTKCGGYDLGDGI